MIKLNDLARLPELFGGRVANGLYYGAWVKVVLDAKGKCHVLAFGQEYQIMSVPQLHKLVSSLIQRKATLS